MSLFVVFLNEQGECPEVGRCPVEDNGEEPDCGQAQVACDGGPTDQYRNCSCGPTDNDVLGRGTFESERVDEDVEENGGTGQHRAKQVDEGGEDDECANTQDDAEDQCLPRLDATGGQRA